MTSGAASLDEMSAGSDERGDSGTDEDTILSSKENLISANIESFHNSPCVDRIRAGINSRRISKSGSILDPSMSLDSSDAEATQEFISQRFVHLESKLEEYLESMTEEFAQDLEREQKHLILMQEQVDKQAQMIQREVTALNKKLDGETTRRSFVSSEVKGTKEAMAEQLQRQKQELEALHARVEELEAPLFLRNLRRVVAGWLTGCSPWTRDFLPVSRDHALQSRPTHAEECTPAQPQTMEP